MRPAPALSIIIPVLDEGEPLLARLVALQPLRQVGCELIGVDGGSTDDSYRHLQSLCDIATTSPRGRSRQMNTGADLARSELLLFLHADTELPENTLPLVQKALQQADWGRFDVALDNPGTAFKLIGTLINWRSRLTRVSTGDQGLFFRRTFFESLGGFPDIPLMEDVAISKLARRRGRHAPLSAKATTSARRWEQNGIAKTVLLMWWLRLRYFLGTSADELARVYYG